MEGPVMSASSFASPEVLRGMDVERVPVRLSRARVPQARSPSDAEAVAREDVLLRERLDAAVRAGFEEGQRAGHAEGLRRGMAEAASKLQEAVDQACREATRPLRDQEQKLADLLAGLGGLRHAFLAAAEDDMVTLCFDTICRIVAAEALRPEAVRAQLARAAAQHVRGGLVVRMHPQDLDIVQPCLEAAGGEDPVRCVADASLATGGCIVEHEAGLVDARLETMLAACKDVLLATRARGSAPQPSGSGVRA